MKQGDNTFGGIHVFVGISELFKIQVKYTVRKKIIGHSSQRALKMVRRLKWLHVQRLICF